MFRLIKNTKGQAVVEFALVLPVFIFLLLVIMEGGRILGGYLELQNAARDGVRWAAIHTDKTEADVTAYVKERLVFLDHSKMDDPNNVDLVRKQTPNGKDRWAELTLKYPLEILTPIISNLVGNPFNLEVKMVMRSE